MVNQGLSHFRFLSQAFAVVVFAVALSSCGGSPTDGRAAVASAHPLATRAGIDIMEKGGNAFDAAVAVAAVLAVVEPFSSGLGGGGFFLLHDQDKGRQVFVDARETAPLDAEEDLFQDSSGNVIPRLSIDHVKGGGIPGLPAALEYLTEEYGRLSLEDNLAAAIEHAKKGFEVDERYMGRAHWRLKILNKNSRAAGIFLRQGKVPPAGTVIRQPDLANTLQSIATEGSKGFYQGPVAAELVRAVRAAGGIWQQQDLDNYNIIERPPIISYFRGWRLVSAPPPSSGGIALAEIFNMMDALKYDPKAEGANHILVEMMRRAYRDRTLYLGDSDFTPVPIDLLVSPLYAAGLAAGIHPRRATPSELLSGEELPAGGRDTTHFSILDSDGNRVASTLSINYPFGTGFVAGSTGVLVNNEMDDFVARPGVPNVYGLLGGKANAIEPGKRPLSSMSPSFLEGGDRVVILGTPGGSRIITMVLLAALTAMNGGSAEQVAERPRFHHQYLPDLIQVEPKGWSESQIMALKVRGHQVQQRDRTWGDMHVVIQHRDGRVEAAADPRGLGSAKVTDSK